MDSPLRMLVPTGVAVAGPGEKEGAGNFMHSPAVPSLEGVTIGSLYHVDCLPSPPLSMTATKATCKGDQETGSPCPLSS